jgi:hypothetical protein
MTFFNQKEEVLQIELTQYGKYLLSRGKLKPAYYAFFDDDIIYDARYSGVEENNGTAVERIKSSPRIKTQYVFTGIEEQVKKNLELIKSGKENLDSLKLIPTADKHYVLNKRLGTSYLADEKLPSFSIATLNGEIQSTTLLQSGSLTEIPIQKTTLLELKDVEYKIKAENIGSEIPDVEGKTYLARYPDGTAISLTEDYLLLEITENNVENEMKNFDIELFISEIDSKTGEENFIPLNFDQKYENYRNGILLDPENTDQETEDYLTQQRNSDQFRTQNYFNITIDNEIQKNLICKLINKMKQNNSLYDTMYDCADYEEEQKALTASTKNLYSPSFNEDDVKKC